jgi:hypothetical protein
MQYLVAGALGLGLAACSGFRVFVPLLAASVAHRVGWLPSSPGFDWLGTWPALLMLATATVAELAGYYVPLFDHLLDTLTTPASFIAGTLLMTSSLTHLDPTLRWTLVFWWVAARQGLCRAARRCCGPAPQPPRVGWPTHYLLRWKMYWRW